MKTTFTDMSAPHSRVEVTDDLRRYGYGMVWHVQRDTGEGTGNTGRVLVAADYELLTDNEAVVLSEEIWNVAVNGVYYSDEGGARYATQADYDLEHAD